MNITILTDASYCPRTKVSGYGFWITSNRGKFAGEGHFQKLYNSALETEMSAIVIALNRAIYEGIAKPFDKVLVQTDCIGAIDRFNHTEGLKLSDNETGFVARVANIRTEYKWDLVFRHVKGHSERRENRYASNNVCDIKAKFHMRRARWLLKIGELENPNLILPQQVAGE